MALAPRPPGSAATTSLRGLKVATQLSLSVDRRHRQPGTRPVKFGHNLDELHPAWLGAEYDVVQNSVHFAMDPGIRAARVGATDGFESRVKRVLTVS